jgi:hypothetical protein
MPDIDIDFANRTLALDKLKHVTATLEDNSVLKKHNTGVYCTSIPYNPITKMSTINYKDAEARGYFKIDFLNVSVYEKVRNRAHLKTLMETEPLWDLLLEDDFINKLAAVLAVIRPAKRYLIGKDWQTILEDVWIKPDSNEYYFKKAHAIAYAQVIVVQMNLICEELTT